MNVTRPPLRYHGGKWRISDWIISLFPPHVCYVEPFAGGASVLLRKSPAQFEVMNDLDDDVVTFFDVLRTDANNLIRAIELTPYSRAELRRAYERNVQDRLEKARRFYIRCWQSFGSGTGKNQTGWRYQIGDCVDSRASAIASWNKTEHLWAVADRLKLVQIEHDDALACIRRFDSPGTLFYVDPPYLLSTRSRDAATKGYQHDMTESQHESLASLLRTIRGAAIVSGYPSPFYDNLYKGWQRVTKRARDITSQGQTECLWISPAVSALNHLPLFAGGWV